MDAEIHSLKKQKKTFLNDPSCLLGPFAESEQSEVRIPMTSHGALSMLVHYLYGCRWCSSFDDLPVKTLLELVGLSDQYLLNDFNQSVSHEIVHR